MVMYNSPKTRIAIRRTAVRMIRKQIYLKPSQQKQLKSFAKTKNISEAETIRMAIDSFIAQNQSSESNPLQQLVGLCKESAPTDLAEKHDQYLTGEINAKQT